MEVCFAAEKTLGKLAKWLRILGFDTLYEPDLPVGYFSGLEPNRMLLTRRALYRQSRTDNPYRAQHGKDQMPVQRLNSDRITQIRGTSVIRIL